jgi:putative salt-induced outer membrane protein YdiY
LGLLLSFSLAHAIITIVPVRLGEKPGISGKVEGASEKKRGNTDSTNISGSVKVQYDNNSSYAMFGEFTGSYGESNGEENSNKTYVHIRYIHTLYDKRYNWETFAQHESNKFTNVNNRYLGGAGLRYNFLDGEYGDLFFGVGAFQEHITYTTSIDPTEDNTRMNNYIAYTLKFGDNSKLGYVAYYQPKVDDFSDYILSNAFALKVHVYKELSIRFVIFYDIDNKPAIDVEKSDYTQKTSFIWEF